MKMSCVPFGRDCIRIAKAERSATGIEVSGVVKERIKVCTLFEEIAKDSRDEGRTEANIETAKRMLSRGKLSVEEIAEDTNLPIETILKLQKQKDLQLV